MRPQTYRILATLYSLSVSSTAAEQVQIEYNTNLFTSSHSAAVSITSGPPLPNASRLSPKEENSIHPVTATESETVTVTVALPFMRQEESCLYYTSRWLLILNWIKEFVKRVLYNKGYATNPFVLGIVPLLVGIMMGWLLGTYGSLVWSLNWTFRSNNTFVAPANDDDDDDIEDEADTKQERDEKTRQSLQSASHTFESGVDPSHIPQHIAVIMDGNRRYGRSKYQNATRGHEEGSKTLLNFIQWCMAEQVQILTVYAFSTENWQRSPLEVTALMDLILTHVEELRTQALEQGICVNVLSTETEPIPKGVSQGIKRLVEDTKDGKNFTLNICLSYGSRGEIVQACQAISRKVQSGAMDIDDISTTTFHQHLLTASCGADPDLILRTSGEYRLSNFLLWQLAYSELFFLDKTWPEVKKEDLIMVIRKFANDRNRRYGK